MKLFYFKDPAGNFGDDLNPWMWPQLVPELQAVSGRDGWLVGIGTLLNHRLPADVPLHVMGSGVGYGDRMRQDAQVHFHAVRGHKSAAALGLPADTAITDAAVLLRTLSVPASRLPRERVGVMFTGRSLYNYDWEPLCQRLGYAFISCHWSVERVFHEMQRCDVLLTEAMHGAIVADALRVPWVPITCSEGVLAFKWEDWLSTVDLAYEPSVLTPLYDLQRHWDWRVHAKHHLRRGLAPLGLVARSEVQPPSDQAQVEMALRQLQDAAGRPGMLSCESVLDNHVARFERRIAVLRERLNRQA
ncbi:polysaccharide pyruvyl transferase family protein [Ideonella sp. DXS22W]|uniref:Polysaccharide pyruvyl transferase family protein n=1 Tax=Pseudaquabacterium inlustre TaxID=2984192 RepID=A0ABU9CRU3_9BURK